MSSFDDVTRWTEDGDDARLVVDDTWQQGKAIFGGVQAAAALRALEAMVGEGRPLRSVSATFVGQAGTEPLRRDVRILRDGRSVTIGRCDLLSEEGVACTVTAAFGGARTSVVERRTLRGDVVGPEGLMELPYIPGMTPAFVQHMDLRWAEGGLPFSGSDTLEHAGWCRHRTTPGSVAGGLLGLLDAWPAPALQAFQTPAPAATITWSAQILALPDSIGTEDWFYFRARVVGAHGDGFVTMRGELFDVDGAMVAHLEQLVSVYDKRSPRTDPAGPRPRPE